MKELYEILPNIYDWLWLIYYQTDLFGNKISVETSFDSQHEHKSTSH